MMKITRKHNLITGGVIITILVVVFQLFNVDTFQNKITNNRTKKAPFSVQTFRADGKGWGYKIMCNSKTIIKQDIIPAIENAVPFYSEEDAKETGLLVVNKMNSKKLPSVSVAELDSMQIVRGNRMQLVK